MLRGIDYAAFATSFVDKLRAAGIRTGMTHASNLVRALNDSSDSEKLSHPYSLTRMYWLARITLISRPDDIPAFDDVFATVFEQAGSAQFAVYHRQDQFPEQNSDLSLSVTGDAAEQGVQLPWATLPTIQSASSEDAGASWLAERRASDFEGLDDKPFPDFDKHDLLVLQKAIENMMRRWPRRRTRRYRQRRRGNQIDMRATVAQSRRTGWETVELVHRAPVTKHRPLVMLCDVSQSMQPYVSAYLHFMRAATRNVNCEVFAFATSLTRLTGSLRHSQPEEAIDAASNDVLDRFGGTRIASSMRSLVRSHHGQLLRGAVVIVASDGWDSEPPELLAAQMARIRRLAHRVIWLNPRTAEPGFAPRVGGMAAALPFCDLLLPAHTMNELTKAVAFIDDVRSSAASTPQRDVYRGPKFINRHADAANHSLRGSRRI